MTRVAPAAQDLGQPVELGVGVGRQDLGQRRAHRRHRQRVAVERADLVDPAVGDPAHDLLAAADRAARQAAADRLGQAEQVGGDAEALRGAAVGDRGAGLHLVEGEQRARGVQQLLDARQVAVLGQ